MHSLLNLNLDFFILSLWNAFNSDLTEDKYKQVIECYIAQLNYKRIECYIAQFNLKIGWKQHNTIQHIEQFMKFLWSIKDGTCQISVEAYRTYT